MSNSDKLQEIAYMRREYTRGNLRRKDLPAKPMELFKLWFKQICEARITDPNAMVIATVDSFGQPYQRIVLLKHYDEKGLVFYTNLNSQKSRHIDNNPRVSLLFPWHAMERQIVVIGKAKRLNTLEVEKYFHSRPYNNQIVAWASKQSSYILTRKFLENNFFKIKQKFSRGKVLLPNFWGGFRISIEQIEFWQGGKYRLHDRFLYQLNNGKWKIYRLSP